MKIIVCVKRVPLTQEVDLEINAQAKDIRKEVLAYVINEWDHYAIEEAVLIKDNFEGDVTAVTVGSQEDEEILRLCLAMGADRAIRVDPGGLELDAFAVSKILAEVIKRRKFDLILTGVQADDINEGAVGIMLAEHLGLAHAAVVTGIEPGTGGATVRVELEGGTDEVSRVSFPAVLSIQTGINEPRYVSIMGIRKAAKKVLEVVKVKDVGLSDPDLSVKTMVEEIFLPPETDGAQIIEGDPGTVADELLRIIKEKGVSI